MPDNNRTLAESVVQTLKMHQLWLKDRSKGRQAKMAGVNLSDIDLSKVNLRKAELPNAICCRTIFVEADLSDSDLFSADLHGADLTSANLKNAVMRGVMLKGAKLDHANLGGMPIFPNLSHSFNVPGQSKNARARASMLSRGRASGNVFGSSNAVCAV